MCICYKREWNAHADRMLNINLQKFGKAKAILLFSCRIFRRNSIVGINGNGNAGIMYIDCLSGINCGS